MVGSPFESCVSSSIVPEEPSFWDDEGWGDYDPGNEPPLDEVSEDDGRPDIQEILDTLGRESLFDFKVNLKDIADASTIRADRFTSLEDALYFLWEIGVAGIADIVEIEIDVYAVAIPDDTQPK